MRRLVAVLALVALGACSGDGSVLEAGGPRRPDEQGVATDVTLERIQIDGKRTYAIAGTVESFTTRAHQITPLLSWEGKYVHIGLDDDDQVRWIAGIGILSGKPPRVTYSGIVSSVDQSSHEAIFEDGTVLTFVPSLRTPKEGDEIVVEIDAGRDLVVRVLS